MYYYVDGKQDLLFRVLQSSTDQYLSALEEIANSDKPAIAKLIAAVNTHIRFVLDNPTGVAVFLRERRFLPTEQRNEYNARIDHYDRLFSSFIAEAMANGDIPDGDPVLLRLLGLGAINWIVEWYNPTGAASREALERSLAEIILNRMFGVSSAASTPHS